jgi:hypothetical protein
VDSGLYNNKSIFANMLGAATTLAVLAMATGFASADFGNDPPVPGRRPVWYTGHWKSGVEIEVVYDLMCADSAALNPEFQKFLDMPWLDSTVRDQVQLSYTFLPLPYHHGVWIPHLIVPYILDVCHADATKCIFQEYMEYCFDHQGDILDAKDTSQDDLIKSWTK